MPSNATPRISREEKVTVADHGENLSLGDAHDGRTSVWFVQFVPDANWQGGFGVLGRAYGNPANVDSVAFVPIPYRRVNLAGAASDRALVSAALNNTSFIIEIPANGLHVSLLTACSAGSGKLYSWPLSGSPT
jgi:hypothetical protein